MKKNGNNFELEELVFKVFMKHVKANKLYIAFRWSVNQDNANKDLVHVLSSMLYPNRYYSSKDKIARIGCSFISAHSIHDILAIMNADRGKHKIENNSQFQLSLMNMVNMLVHSCIEHALTHDIHLLEKIGSAVFEEVGKKLFGDDFKDLTEEAIDPRQRGFMEEMKNQIGGLPPDMSSNDFLKIMHDRMKQVLERRRRDEERRYHEVPLMTCFNYSNDNIWDDWDSSF